MCRKPGLDYSRTVSRPAHITRIILVQEREKLKLELSAAVQSKKVETKEIKRLAEASMGADWTKKILEGAKMVTSKRLIFLPPSSRRSYSASLTLRRRKHETINWLR